MAKRIAGGELAERVLGADAAQGHVHFVGVDAYVAPSDGLRPQAPCSALFVDASGPGSFADRISDLDRLRRERLSQGGLALVLLVSRRSGWGRRFWGLIARALFARRRPEPSLEALCEALLAVRARDIQHITIRQWPWLTIVLGRTTGRIDRSDE